MVFLVIWSLVIGITLKIARLSPSPLAGEGEGEGDIQYAPPSSPVKGEDNPG
jgi:hypothetical protein